MNIPFVCEMLLLLIAFPLYCKINGDLRKRDFSSELLSQNLNSNKQHSDKRPVTDGSRVVSGFFEPE